MQFLELLMDKLNEILSKIQSLAKEADKYDSEHITQDFRRINAECVKLQMSLDRIVVDDNEDARLLRRTGINEAETAARKISSKIHKGNTKTCPDCLKIGN